MGTWIFWHLASGFLPSVAWMCLCTYPRHLNGLLTHPPQTLVVCHLWGIAEQLLWCRKKQTNKTRHFLRLWQDSNTYFLSWPVTIWISPSGGKMRDIFHQLSGSRGPQWGHGKGILVYVPLMEAVTVWSRLVLFMMVVKSLQPFI